VAATLIHLPASASQAAVNAAVAAAGRDPAVDGVLVQLPLPPHLDPGAALSHLPPHKDVDGALPAGLGTLLARGGSGEQQAWGSPDGLVPLPTPASPPPPFFTPCTALGAAALLARAGLWGPAALGGATAVLVGDSPTVGLPLAALLRGAGVGFTTLVHRPATAPLFEGEDEKGGGGGGGAATADGARAAAGACLPSPTTTSLSHPAAPSPGDASPLAAAARAALAERVRTADILVAAVGVAGGIPGDWLKPGCLVLDVGINVLADTGLPGGYRVVGDVCPAGAGTVAAAVTPVPGGLGPMTIAALLHNTVAAAAGSAGAAEVEGVGGGGGGAAAQGVVAVECV
jgi:methylenetetrahydrofolate dehydrogenase (NADP+)/methenyltetrahydrofolate cyclohydrolase